MHILLGCCNLCCIANIIRYHYYYNVISTILFYLPFAIRLLYQPTNPPAPLSRFLPCECIFDKTNYIHFHVCYALIKILLFNLFNSKTYPGATFEQWFFPLHRKQGHLSLGGRNIEKLEGISIINLMLLIFVCTAALSL